MIRYIAEFFERLLNDPLLYVLTALLIFREDLKTTEHLIYIIVTFSSYDIFRRSISSFIDNMQDDDDDDNNYYKPILT